MVAGVLSLIGAAVAFALVFAYRDPISMQTVIGVVLLLNAAVRFRLAGTLPNDTSER
ncbi:MAG: hypothetical protein WCQ48_00170 [Chloroflexota bacterium]